VWESPGAILPAGGVSTTAAAGVDVEVVVGGGVVVVVLVVVLAEVVADVLGIDVVEDGPIVPVAATGSPTTSARSRSTTTPTPTTSNATTAATNHRLDITTPIRQAKADADRDGRDRAKSSTRWASPRRDMGD
jgi:hypothetical protein